MAQDALQLYPYGNSGSQRGSYSLLMFLAFVILFRHKPVYNTLYSFSLLVNVNRNFQLSFQFRSTSLRVGDGRVIEFSDD